MTTTKKAAMLISALAVIAIIAVGATLAYFTDTDTKQNVFTLGKVSGTLTEDGSTDGTKREDGGRDYTSITPGKTLSKVPVITLDAKSQNAYARMKIDYTGLTASQIAEFQAGITLNPGWVLGSDGYFYYNTVLNPGDTATIFNTVTIPATWGNEMAEKSFSMNLKAELIQSDNFTPTKDTAGNITSWGNVTIEAAK